MAKLFPILIILVALLGGAGVGQFLKPAPDPEGAEMAESDGDAPDAGHAAEDDGEHGAAQETVVTFRDGFIVPILRDGQVWSHMILQLGVEAEGSTEETILLREPILRDALTEALFLHGNLGGFDGDFTEPGAMARLRDRLDAVIGGKLGDPTARVLIASLARQST